MPQERLYRTEAIVLHALDYAEADRILTLLTPQGKLTVLARAVRRPTSRKSGHLSLFSRVQLMLARGHNLDVIAQVECVEDYAELGADLLRFTYACYVGELAERFAQEGDEAELLYELVVETLQRLVQTPDPALWLRYYELRLLDQVGYRPELFACVNCHQPIVSATNYFGREQGGLLCYRCGPANAEAKAVSVAAQKVLRFLQTRDADQVARLRIRPATHAEVEALLWGYLEHVLERELKSVVFLQRLRRELRSAEEARPANAGDEASAPDELL